MESAKPLSFKGTAGGFFVATVVSTVMAYIIIIGWPIAFNFMNGWIVDNLEINGRKLKYSAGYGEVLGFLLVNMLLIIITFGIYSFWFYPKAYRFVADHSAYSDEAASAPTAEDTPEAITV